MSDDWEFPDTECLAFGPHGGSHIFAGCAGGLYKTDPLHAWHQVKLPANVHTVYRIVTTSEPPRVVIATDRSIWWAAGNAGAAYAWQEAKGLDAAAPFFGLARSDLGVIAAVRNSAASQAGGSASLGGKGLSTTTVSGISGMPPTWS